MLRIDTFNPEFQCSYFRVRFLLAQNAYFGPGVLAASSPPRKLKTENLLIPFFEFDFDTGKQSHAFSLPNPSCLLILLKYTVNPRGNCHKSFDHIKVNYMT